MPLEVVHWHENWRRSYGADFWSRFLERVSGTLGRILTVTYFMMIALTILLLLV